MNVSVSGLMKECEVGVTTSHKYIEPQVLRSNDKTINYKTIMSVKEVSQVDNHLF